MNMFLNFEDFFRPYADMPLVGPLREYQEKWQQLVQSWLRLLTSASNFAMQLPQFTTALTTNFPQFFGSVTLSAQQPQTLLQVSNEYLKYLDKSWEQVMSSDDYARKSAELVASAMDFRQAVTNLSTSLAGSSPLGIPTNMSEYLAQLEKTTREFVSKVQSGQPSQSSSDEKKEK